MSINKGRVRWHCRRALLELDLVFTRFLERHFDHLDDDQLAVLQEMLDCEDHELWALVNGSQPCTHAHWQPVLTLLRQA